MFNWLKRKIQLKAVELQTQDIQRFLAVLKGMTDNEIGMVVAVATGIRLKIEEQGHDIEAEMEAAVPEFSDLAKSATSLSKTIEDAQSTPEKRPVCMGMMVWLHSVRAYVNPEIRYLAQAMWKELQRGFPYADEQCEFIRTTGLANMPVAAELHTDYVPCLLRPFREDALPGTHMFGFFRTKQPPGKVPALSDIVELGDLPFIRIVKSMVADNEPAGLSMLVVAYQNQEPLIKATFNLAKKRPQEGLPTDLRSYIRYLGRALEQPTDEFGSRRLGWFFQAALVRRASDLAAFSPVFEDDVVDIWITLARGAGLLHEVLTTNILWSEDDKAYFKHIRTEKEGISYCLQLLMPRHLRANARLNAFAEESDIFFIP